MKYKIKFKGLDKKYELTKFGFWPYKLNKEVWESKYNQLRDDLTEFIKRHYKFLSNDYEKHNLLLEDQGSPVIAGFYEKNGIKYSIWIDWDIEDVNKIVAWKQSHESYPVKIVPFDEYELEWLDRNNIPLDEKHIKQTKQNITDWF